MLCFNYTLQPQAYCAILVRRSNFRHQASPLMSPCESTQRQKVELWTRNVRQFCLNADFHVTFRDLLHGDRRLYFLSKGGRAEDFFALKIRRLRPGVNPQTWVPKASMLPLDHCRCLTFKNHASYIQDGHTTTLQMLHSIYIFLTNISTEYFKHAAHSLFFSSKCPLFHNATFFGSCIIHILHTRCAKI